MVRASGTCLDGPGFNFQSGCLFCLTHRAAPDWEEKSFYSQLKHVLVVKLPPASELDVEDNSLHAETMCLLTCIHTCDVDKRNSLEMLIYSKMGASEVVDLDQLSAWWEG